MQQQPDEECFKKNQHQHREAGSSTIMSWSQGANPPATGRKLDDDMGSPDEAGVGWDCKGEHSQFIRSKCLIQLRQTAHVYHSNNNKIYYLSMRLNQMTKEFTRCMVYWVDPRRVYPFFFAFLFYSMQKFLWRDNTQISLHTFPFFLSSQSPLLNQCRTGGFPT